MEVVVVLEVMVGSGGSRGKIETGGQVLRILSAGIGVSWWWLSLVITGSWN